MGLKQRGMDMKQKHKPVSEESSEEKPKRGNKNNKEEKPKSKEGSKAGKDEKPIRKEESKNSKTEKTESNKESKTSKTEKNNAKEESKNNSRANSKAAIKKKVKESESEEEDDGTDTEYAIPTKARSAYILFSIENRPRITEKNPDANGRELMSLIGAAWKICDEAEKKKFEAMAEEDKERFTRQMEEYEDEGKFYDEKGNAVIKERKPRKRSVKKSSEGMMKKKRGID